MRQAISAEGLEQSPVIGVHLKGVKITAATAGEIHYAKDWDLGGIGIITLDNSKLDIQHAENIKL